MLLNFLWDKSCNGLKHGFKCDITILPTGNCGPSIGPPPFGGCPSAPPQLPNTQPLAIQPISYVSGYTATYTCAYCYRSTIPIVRTCQNGQWIGNEHCAGE